MNIGGGEAADQLVRMMPVSYTHLPLGAGPCLFQPLLVKYDRDAQVMRTLRLSLHFKCKNRAIHIDLLTELHQTQAHLLCRLFLNRIAGGGDKCEQEVRARCV